MSEYYIFTFGFDHRYPGGYVKIEGNYGEARAEMVERYGVKWAFQYPSEEKAGVERFNLYEVL